MVWVNVFHVTLADDKSEPTLPIEEVRTAEGIRDAPQGMYYEGEGLCFLMCLRVEINPITLFNKYNYAVLEWGDFYKMDIPEEKYNSHYQIIPSYSNKKYSYDLHPFD